MLRRFARTIGFGAAMVGMFGISVALNGTSTVAPHPNSLDGTQLAATARTLEPYLVRQPDGTLALNAPRSVTAKLPASYVEDLFVGLGNTNALILAGKLKTTQAGAVFDPTADAFVVQGGWTGHGYDWWHDYYCLNHSDLVAFNNGWWWDLSGSGAALLALFSGVIGGTVGVVLYGFKAWMVAVDRGNGSCLNAGHWPPPNLWVTGQ